MVRNIRIAAALLGIMACSGRAQIFESLYTFKTDGSDGAKPIPSLILGPDGKVYGTTTEGGAFDGGTVFRVSPDKSVEILGSFNPATTGKEPTSPLLDIGDGYLYGVTHRNAVPNSNIAGTLYRLDPLAPANGAGEGGLTPIFQVPGTGGTLPYKARGLTLAEPNVIDVICEDFAGIWRVPLDGSAPPSVLRFFGTPSLDGAMAYSLVRGRDGYLYGTTISGKAAASPTTTISGTIFRLATDGTEMTRLHECDGVTGDNPGSAPVQGPDGNFYGVMWYGGPAGRASNGFLYRITPDGDYTVLHYFNDLRYPRGELLFATDGYIYGVANIGGVSGYGGVYRIKRDGSGYKVLHQFNNMNGGYPVAGLAQGVDGNLYGSTYQGGSTAQGPSTGRGTIYRLKLKLPELPENRPPTALDDFATCTGDSVTINALANDIDPDGDGLIIAIDDAPAHGSAVVQPGGLILYQPDETYTTEDEFTYIISDGRGGESTATVRIRTVTPEPLVQKKVYNGLLQSDPELKLTFDGTLTRAQFTVSVAANGRFTGALTTRRTRVPLKGVFGPSASAMLKLKLPGRVNATLFLNLVAGEPNRIIAVLYGAENWSGYASPIRANDSTVRQTYTVGIETDTPLPAGYGYGTMRVMPTGGVVIVGKLGDGSPLGWSTSLVNLPGNVKGIPVFSEPLPGGVCAGYLLPNQGAGRDFGGDLRWIRPHAPKSRKPLPYERGFDTTAQFSAALYTAPSAKEPVLSITEAILSAGGGPLANTATANFTLNGNRVLIEAPLRALAFDRASGLFTGKILTVDKKLISFRGSVNQALKAGIGQFVISGVTGAVVFGEPVQ